MTNLKLITDFIDVYRSDNFLCIQKEIIGNNIISFLNLSKTLYSGTMEEDKIKEIVIQDTIELTSSYICPKIHHNFRERLRSILETIY